MFETLSERLGAILDKLTRKGALSEADVGEAMREVRRALLEADVALDVVRSFTDRVREKAVGQDVVRSITPGQMVVKIVHDELVRDARLGRASRSTSPRTPPVPMMLVGLQGSGKTTTTAKLAKRLAERDKQKVLMASLDTRRPAAQEQLRVLGEQTGVATLPIVAGQTPVEIAVARAARRRKLGGYDVVHARHRRPHPYRRRADGRDGGDREVAHPHETLLVADALTGQDAVNLAKSFNERVGVTGIVLTRVDGDGRGGAALSMRAVTGKPIKLIGTGEKLDALEDFHPERIAGRILGMGDVVGLVEKAAADTSTLEKAAGHGAARSRRATSTSTTSPSSSSRCRSSAACRRARHAARHRQGEEADRRRQSRRPHPQAPAGDHLLDDARERRNPKILDGKPQAARRGRLRHDGAGHQQAPEDAPADGRHDEGHGQEARHLQPDVRIGAA